MEVDFQLINLQLVNLEPVIEQKVHRNAPFYFYGCCRRSLQLGIALTSLYFMD